MGQHIMDTPSLFLIIAFAPLVTALLAGLFGTGFLGRFICKKAAHSLTILGVLISFIGSVMVLMQTVDGMVYDGAVYTWSVIGGVAWEIGFLIDNLTAIMMVVVTSVSLMVHIYTIGYMADDPGYQRFFSYISLFTFSMLMLVMSNNMLQLFFGWEAVGLVSYLLIGFWYERESAVFANMKAFLMNRVGDFGFVLGIGLLYAYTGSMNYRDVFSQLDVLGQLQFPGTTWNLVTVACVALFVGAMGKSAQVPLHSWLPDSMEGPTPISALIHAATMVTAGIFMVARFSPLYELSPAALSLVVVVGAIGALFLGILGIIQNDIKRVVAYSTLSQLGYMTVALGVSAYSVAIFHLMTHAFYKALLFLGAGSVIVSMHHNQDIRAMGGLRKYLPLTWITFLLGTFALVGVPFFSGYYSKEHIIQAANLAADNGMWGAGFAYYMVHIGVFVSSLYSFRLYFIVFHGKENFRNPPAEALHDVEGEQAEELQSGNSKESPWSIVLPLVLLAIPSIFAGIWFTDSVLFGSFFEGAIFVAPDQPVMSQLAAGWHGWVEYALHGFATSPFWLMVAGAVVAWYLYLVNPAVPAAIRRRFAGLYRLLENKYYVDWFYEQVLARGARCLGVGLWKGGDASLIDGLIVNGSARVVGWLGAISRHLQTGFIYHYAFAMILGILALLTFFVLTV